MARAGFCRECDTNVWVDDSGACVNGHPPESVGNVYETEPSPPALAPEPVKKGLSTRAGKALGLTKSLSPAELELREAEKEHSQSVKTAEKNLKSVTKLWDKKLRDAETQLQSAQAHGTHKLGSYGAVTLFENSLLTPQGTVNLEVEQASAAVDTAGSLMETRRSTLTRMAAGGILLGPVGLLGGGMLKKKGQVDTRELYLVIESSSVASIVECKPEDGARVRQFATAINNASRSAAGLAQQRSQLVEQWTQCVASLRAERQEAISQAERQLQETLAGTYRVDCARKLLKEEVASSGAEGAPG